MMLLGECDVEAILQRLDRLTQEEGRVTAAHTLEVVHELFENLKVVMGGAYETFFAWTSNDSFSVVRTPNRWKDVKR
jgi:hypothetical protein